MKEKLPKTNAARLLDRAKVAYELVAYPVDESDLSATHVAEVLGEDPKAVFKTIVLTTVNPNGHIVCIVPADTEIDLKKAARAAGVKKAEPLPLKELLPLTGYIRGGCTCIGMKKPLPVLIDSTAEPQERIFVSAGQRGLQLHLSPIDLARVAGAQFAELTSDPAAQ